MKWTTEQTTDLKDLCMAEMQNDDIAVYFGVPVSEIHAKRSQLGITRAKIAAAKGKPGMTVNPEFEAAVVEMEATLTRKGLSQRIVKAFEVLGTEVLLKMAHDYTSIEDARIYCVLSDELVNLKEKYERLLRKDKTALGLQSKSGVIEN